MIKIINTPSKFKTNILLSLDNKTYNEYYKYKFSLNEYQRYLMVKEFIKPFTGKYRKIERFPFFNDETYEIKSGCGIELYDELESEGHYICKTSDDSFSFGGSTYLFKEDGLYSNDDINEYGEKLKRRNKLEEKYT